MNRTHGWLLGLLLLQVVLILILRSPFSTGSTGTETHPLLPGLEAFSAARMEIDGADGERVTLTRSGDGWGLDDLGGFPVDEGKVDRVLRKLEEIEVRRPLVTQSTYHDSFRVADDEHEARLRIWAAGEDDARVDLILGSSANYRTTHARVGGQDDVYEIRGLAPYDVSPVSDFWIRKELADDVDGEVDRIELRNVQGSFALVRHEGLWTVAAPAGREDEKLNQDEVLSLLRTVTGLRLADAAGLLDETAQGFVEPAATLVLGWSGTEEGAGPGELTIEVGGPVPDREDQRHITRSGFGFAGTIWESSVRRLLEETLETLREEAEEG